MARHNRIFCWDVTYHYPKRVGSVKFLDVHSHTREGAKLAVATNSDDFGTPEVIQERGIPVRISAKKHAYYHDWNATLEEGK